MGTNNANTDISSKEFILTEKDRIYRNFQARKFNIKKVVPAVNMQIEVNVDKLLCVRKEINETSDVHVTIYSFLLKEIASVLINYPLLYSLYYKNKIIKNETLIINVLVSVDNHVEYALIRDPEKKSLKEIAVELQQNITAIKQDKNAFTNALIKMDKLNKIGALIYVMRNFKNPVYFIRKYYGYFPVSNFGTFNIAKGNAIISEPVVASFVVGKVDKKLTMHDDKTKEENIITFSLSFDHRVMDGAYAGAFLSELKDEIENHIDGKQ